jgi:tripartite-type tricarboxylate transporter receptor subunit TctC
MAFTSSFLLPSFALSLWAGCVLCASAVVTLAAEPRPADYPARPIRIVVPQSPGGTTDFTARIIAPRLSERVGQTVVIDNRAGAGSMLGIDLVAKAAADGYTLLIAASALTIIPSKDYDESTSNGLFAPARTPSAVIDKLNAEVRAILAARDTHERVAAQGAEPVGTSPEEFEAIVKRDVPKWARVIRGAGIQPE